MLHAKLCIKEVGHLTKSVGHAQSTLVNQLKSVLLKDLKISGKPLSIRELSIEKNCEGQNG